MTGERWNQIEGVFLRALEVEAGQRERFLEEVCGGDQRLREEVESLLACDIPERPLVNPSFLKGARAEIGEGERLGEMEGERIGPYRVVRLLGSGGMGSVYLAVRDDDHFQKEVALKLLKRGMDTEFMLSRFRQERQILASLEHPFIARLLDGGATEGGLPYFVMEYVDGCAITKYCEERGLELAERLRLFRLVCEAVQYAHQNLVIHRDLKPGNILITKERIPKLLDFGIAKLMQGQSSSETATLTRPEHRMLTPDYASPEQFLGQAISTASDIYSLGAVLYELLTGQRPHRLMGEMGKPVGEVEPTKPSVVVRRAGVGSARVVKHRSRQLSGDLDNIILMALKREPQRRYPSVSELAEDLRRYLEGQPVMAREDRLSYRVGKFIRRNKLGVGAAALLLLTLTGGIISTTFQARRAERRFQLARQLAKAVMVEVRGPLERLPGSTAARAAIIQTVLRYLDGLANEPSTDPAFQLEIADAYRSVAYVEGSPFQQNLGQSAAALNHYEKALALYSQVYIDFTNHAETQAHALGGLIGTNIEAGDIETRTGHPAAALVRLQKMATMAQEATDRDSTLVPPGTWIYLYFRLANVETRSGRSDRALAYAHKALEICQGWASKEHSINARSTLRGAYAILASAQAEMGDLYGARSNYETAIKVVSEALRQPDATVYERSMLAAAYQALGDLLGNHKDLNLGDNAGALRYSLMAVDIAEQIAAADRQDVRARNDLAGTYRSLAAVLLARKPAESLADYEKALALTNDLRIINPSNITYQIDLVDTQIGIAEALEASGSDAAALEHAKVALELAESLAASVPNETSRIRDLIQAQITKGTLLAKFGDFAGAIENCQRALGHADNLIKQAPSNLLFQRDRADVWESLGRYYRTLSIQPGNSESKRTMLNAEARSWFQKSLSLWQDWSRQKLATPYAATRQNQAARELAVCMNAS